MLAVVRFEGQRLLVAANEQTVAVLANAVIIEDAAEAKLPAEVVVGAAAPEQLSVVKEALAPSSFLDVLRSYTVRTTVDPK